MIEVALESHSKQQIALQNVKPYYRCQLLASQNQAIVYDRYRFDLIDLQAAQDKHRARSKSPLNPQQSQIQKLLSLRDSIVHLTFQNQTLTVVTNKAAVLAYDFSQDSSREFEGTKVEGFKAWSTSLVQKLQKNKSKFEAISRETSQAAVYACGSDLVHFDGQQVTVNSVKVMTCEACGVDWDREKAVVFIAGVTKVVQNHVECTALIIDQGETLSLSSQVKFKKWLLPIKREEEPQLLFVTCCSRTLKVIVSVNLPWDSYLCAPFAPSSQRTVVSLRAKASTVVGCEVATLQNVEFCHQSQLVTVELTSGNVIIFDQ